MNAEQKLYELLRELAIPYTLYEHEPAFTVEQSEQVASFVPGMHCKNLFLKDDKKRLWLICAYNKATIALKEVAKQIDAPGLRFAQPELLGHSLGVKPGSVTVFGIMNDTDHAVNVILDQRLIDAPLVSFHPLRNTATITITSQDMVRFINHCGNPMRVITM